MFYFFNFIYLFMYNSLIFLMLLIFIAYYYVNLDVYSIVPKRVNLIFFGIRLDDFGLLCAIILRRSMLRLCGLYSSSYEIKTKLFYPKMFSDSEKIKL